MHTAQVVLVLAGASEAVGDILQKVRIFGYASA